MLDMPVIPTEGKVKMNYLRYKRNAVLTTFLGVVTWTALSTFMLMAKSAIGIDHISILEMVMWVSGALGVYLAHSAVRSYKTVTLLDILIESIFLIGLYIALLTSDGLVYPGLMVYAVIIISAVIHTVQAEAGRYHEDVSLTSMHQKRVLKRLRSLYQRATILGGAIGSTISVVALSVLHVDLVQYTLIMLVLNVIQNVYDYIIWRKL